MAHKRGRPYEQDLRDRVFASADIGLPVGRIAEVLFVSISYVSKVLSRRARTGETTARPQRCQVQPKLTGFLAQLRERVTTHPDSTLSELKAWLLDAYQVSASQSLLSETLRQMGLTLKKVDPRRRADPRRRGPSPRGLEGRAGQTRPQQDHLHR